MWKESSHSLPGLHGSSPKGTKSRLSNNSLKEIPPTQFPFKITLYWHTCIGRVSKSYLPLNAFYMPGTFLIVYVYVFILCLQYSYEEDIITISMFTYEEAGTHEAYIIYPRSYSKWVTEPACLLFNPHFYPLHHIDYFL